MVLMEYKINVPCKPPPMFLRIKSDKKWGSDTSKYGIYFKMIWTGKLGCKIYGDYQRMCIISSEISGCNVNSYEDDSLLCRVVSKK
jgi:hypothetical protein